ncbi:MAG: F0F1 ATP synthase subunit alpha [Oscillospiraceae bacterium]|nr:F0F1 ATP synthase subunit alpha [Oscillospiraceae bacterium]
MAEKTNEKKAILQSAEAPTEQQKRRLSAFVERNYGEKLPLEWQAAPELTGGFKLYVGQDVYDWSIEGRMRQFHERMNRVDPGPGKKNILPLIRSAMEDFSPAVVREERGEVISVGDEIARVRGLPNAEYGEILEFSGGVRGMVQDLREDSIGCVLFGDDGGVTAGSAVRATGRTAGIPVGSKFLGRVVDALGSPIDGKGSIAADDYRPIELPAPGILERQSVDTPLETGILCIDSMFPIGRGQRELIIGDRQTGKTAIAVDTILNQKGRNVICIYVAIGQKTGSVAQLAANLERMGAMNYTVIVSAPASAPASEQYIAPYAGTALGEHFMYTGRDVLIVYDDLSKHAIAYRTLSLLLERSPGREAFPGDVFYLHSRLLERSAHLCDELGGGSLSALPIIETQAGDVSAYIPTNVISITDGQIYLESSLFFSGQRPAVNVGLSVSRVGGAAQTPAMKRSSGSLRLDLAQYREMEVFTQFSSDLDEVTKKQLAYGHGLMMLLRQNQYSPLSRHRQVTLLVAALAHTLEEIPVELMNDYREKLMEEVERSHRAICLSIDKSGTLSDADRAKLEDTARVFVKQYMGRLYEDGES